jgi:pimeloyl-ACP methyl ester carboxylesterase
MPGLGDSDPPNDVRDIWSVTDCVDHAVNSLLPRDRQFYLTGFSFGGMVSGHLSTRMPERIKRIVFVGAGGLKATRKPTEKLHKLLPSMAPQVAGRRGAAQSRAADAARPEERRRRRHVHADHEHHARQDPQPRHGHCRRAVQRLPRVKTPFTGIWGEFDSTTYPYIQERIDLFTALQPDFRMHIIPGAGHWVAYEAADAFNAKLLEVLK